VTVFVDTSAFYAVLDRGDENHASAKACWIDLLSAGSALFTNNYVLLETSALLQHRLGTAALRAFHQEITPLLATDWVSESRHLAGVEAALVAHRRKLSIVDCVSFQTMRDLQIDAVFCFDPHFREQGFKTVP